MSQTDPEEILGLSWNGSPNLTNVWSHPFCPQGGDSEFGCEVTDWNGTWFAIHDPVSGSGMIVRHAWSPYAVALWVDMDGGSATTASSVLLLQPPGGFTGTVLETESLCFYDSSIWTPSLTLPRGC